MKLIGFFVVIAFVSLLFVPIRGTIEAISLITADDQTEITLTNVAEDEALSLNSISPAAGFDDTPFVMPEEFGPAFQNSTIGGFADPATQLETSTDLELDL